MKCKFCGCPTLELKRDSVGPYYQCPRCGATEVDLPKTTYETVVREYDPLYDREVYRPGRGARKR
jgi:hypothetical protein